MFSTQLMLLWWSPCHLVCKLPTWSRGEVFQRGGVQGTEKERNTKKTTSGNLQCSSIFPGDLRENRLLLHWVITESVSVSPLSAKPGQSDLTWTLPLNSAAGQSPSCWTDPSAMCLCFTCSLSQLSLDSTLKQGPSGSMHFTAQMSKHRLGIQFSSMQTWPQAFKAGPGPELWNCYQSQ